MKIQRYLTKERENRDLFGEHEGRVSHWDFDWYLGKDKIGIEGNPSSEAESFIGGILVTDDSLIISTDEKNPYIGKVEDSTGVICSHDSPDPKERLKLAKMLAENETIHLYVSNLDENGYESVLTFSKEAPSKERYTQGKSLQVKLEED